MPALRPGRSSLGGPIRDFRAHALRLFPLRARARPGGGGRDQGSGEHQEHDLPAWRAACDDRAGQRRQTQFGETYCGHGSARAAGVVAASPVAAAAMPVRIRADRRRDGSSLTTIPPSTLGPSASPRPR